MIKYSNTNIRRATVEKRVLKCFISYSHYDKKMCEKFITHLGNIERFVDVKHWYDGMIPPGGNIDNEVKRQLKIADVVFLLITPNFISSFYCYEKELVAAIKRSEKGKCIVIPVVLRDFVKGDYIFSGLKFVPTDGTPIDHFRPLNRGFVDAFGGISNLLIEFNEKRSRSNVIGCDKDSHKTDVIQFGIVKNGKIENVVLTPKIFSDVVFISHKLAHFSTDVNTLMLEIGENFKSVLSEKTTPKNRNNFYRKNMVNFLFELSGHIQYHFIGYDNTCIHIRVRNNDIYRDYLDGGVGYNKVGLSLAPIQAQNGMIDCAIRNNLPVIKTYNRSIHKKSHPNEKIRRNYITFAFNNLSKLYNINLSMCISLVGANALQKNGILTAMSIVRFDLLIEKYLLQYISYCSKIDSNYNVGVIF